MKRYTAQRQRPRFFFIGMFLLPFVILIVLYIIISTVAMPAQRTSVLLLTDPVEVASFDPHESVWSIIRFPTSTHVSGIQGLGEYAIDSLWNIAATEGSPSAVVLGSLTDELGIPIDYFVGKKSKRWETQKPATVATSSYFSIPGIISYVLHKQETNLPFPLYLSLSRSFQSTEFHTVHNITLVPTSGLLEQTLPDHSSIYILSREQFDYITDDIFEDPDVRSERLRIAVFNTTGSPFLGSRVSRILTKLGGNVVQVGNDSKQINTCEVSGNSNTLQTQTAQLIVRLFACKTVSDKETGRADLTVKIGSIYAGRFLPKVK